MKTKEITYLGLLMALTVLLGVIPNIGIIQVGPVSITILHIPVIMASVMFDIKGGLIVGTTFGLTSMYVAMTRAASPIDLLFVNPLVSVVPRALFGLACGVLCYFVDENSKLKYAMIGFFSTLIHTLLVYLALYMFGKETIDAIMGNSTLARFLLSAISVNAIIEAAVASIFAVLILSKVAKSRYSKV